MLGFRLNLCSCSILGLVIAMPALAAAPLQIEARSKGTIEQDGKLFKDLDGNGKLDPYEDWRLPAPRRVDDLITRMSVPEKAGLMMFASHGGFMGPDGQVLDTTAPPPKGTLKSPVNVSGVPGFDPADKPSPRDLIVNRHVRWIGTSPGGDAAAFARWANAVQAMAESTRLGIPVVLASDPIHTTNRLPGGALPPPDRRKLTSSWPDQIGFAAIGDVGLVERFGQIGAAEFRALGMRVVVNPIADVATEPRWNRIPGTFGEDADLSAKMTAAYVRGFQGRTFGSSSVMTIVKHFPGDGPVAHGLDPHNPYGKYLVYPAGMQAYHLKPFKAAIAAGAQSIMTSYGIPTGLDTVGSSFSKAVVSGLLRDKLDFRGIVISDWLHAMPWGVESLSKEDREARMIAAGVDQFGGEHETRYVIDLVQRGVVPLSRLNESVSRILLPMFEMGLFEDPYVDPANATKVVNSQVFRAVAAEAQRRAVVLLKNADGVLPLRAEERVELLGFSTVPEALAPHIAVDEKSADAVIVKVNAPYHVNASGQAFFKETHEGPLLYKGANNESDLTLINRAVASGKPVIVVMSMERPAVLSEFLGRVDGMLATFGSDDDAVADILLGKATPSGKLPFDLPADEASVEHQKEDAPHDFSNTLFRQGFGLAYQSK